MCFMFYLSLSKTADVKIYKGTMIANLIRKGKLGSLYCDYVLEFDIGLYGTYPQVVKDRSSELRRIYLIVELSKM